MKRYLLLPLLVIFLVGSTGLAFANHGELVLGDSTTVVNPQIPPTSDGPGLILPDSPLFFLDQLKQQIRVIFALTPEAKAKVHSEIAGERMAELRIMLARDNKAGIKTDLDSIAQNIKAAAADVNDAHLTGRDVSSLAKQINDTIKTKQKILDTLETQTTGELTAQVKATTASLLPAKVQVEDSLPQQDIESEIRDDLQRQVRKKVDEASASAKKIEEEINELQKEASESASKSLKRREEAIKKALQDKNETLHKVLEKELEAERKKQEDLFGIQQKAAEEAHRAMEAAKAATTQLQKADEIRNKSVNGGSGSGGSSGGGSSGSSGGSSSGSSSGSGSSGGSGGGDSGGSHGGDSGKSGGGDSGKSGGDSGKSGKN